MSESKPLRILHIDDDPVILHLAHRILERAGFVIESLPSAETFDELVLDDFALLLIDWMLPKTTGLEVSRRARERGYKAPILMLSGKELGREEKHALEDYDVQVMFKPFGPHHLIARVREVLSE